MGARGHPLPAVLTDAPTHRQCSRCIRFVDEAPDIVE